MVAGYLAGWRQAGSQTEGSLRHLHRWGYSLSVGVCLTRSCGGPWLQAELPPQRQSLTCLEESSSEGETQRHQSTAADQATSPTVWSATLDLIGRQKVFLQINMAKSPPHSTHGLPGTHTCQWAAAKKAGINKRQIIFNSMKCVTTEFQTLHAGKKMLPQYSYNMHIVTNLLTQNILAEDLTSYPNYMFNEVLFLKT